MKTATIIVLASALAACATPPPQTSEGEFNKLCNWARYQATHNDHGWRDTIQKMRDLEPSQMGPFTDYKAGGTHAHNCVMGMIDDRILYDPTPPGVTCMSMPSVTGAYITECP